MGAQLAVPLDSTYQKFELPGVLTIIAAAGVGIISIDEEGNATLSEGDRPVNIGDGDVAFVLQGGVVLSVTSIEIRDGDGNTISRGYIESYFQGEGLFVLSKDEGVAFYDNTGRESSDFRSYDILGDLDAAHSADFLVEFLSDTEGIIEFKTSAREIQEFLKNAPSFAGRELKTLCGDTFVVEGEAPEPVKATFVIEAGAVDLGDPVVGYLKNVAGEIVSFDGPNWASDLTLFANGEDSKNDMMALIIGDHQDKYLISGARVRLDGEDVGHELEWDSSGSLLQFEAPESDIMKKMQPGEQYTIEIEFLF